MPPIISVVYNEDDEMREFDNIVTERRINGDRNANSQGTSKNKNFSFYKYSKYQPPKQPCDGLTIFLIGKKSNENI